ncbi:alpha/beta hydrolase-fold protein [Macrococcus capreoli]|uniref:alpha/beta hydrolase n=1 Tax=Macrococcus capreoli TaxID=2982690 RepID=UPI0021D604D3|nr:alpha/beta hydrolase-fold protein [Macrococcus sp. TMW 2.2395]MCU7556443.1 alpha/beta hydrolase-fold protein [Macrococcus sp. TMW 2.2395]
MQPGKITPFTIESEQLNRTVKLSIYCPKDYSPFVDHQLSLCFDGQDVSQMGQIHRKYEQLIDQLSDPIVFVFIHYTNAEERRLEYHPNGIHRKAYQLFITDELIPYLNVHYHLSQTAEQTILIGDSLAASIALTLTLEYPALSKRAILFSPMVTPEMIAHIRQLDETQCKQLNYYLIVGNTEDHFQLMTGDDADFLNPIRVLHAVFNACNIQHYYAELDGGHTWKTWKPQIEDALNYYFG